MQRAGVIALPGEDKIADAGGELRCGLEECRIVALDELQRTAERLGKRFGIVVTQKPGDALQPFVIFG